jgi:hypothetical protein
MAKDHVSPPYDDRYYTSLSDDDEPFNGDSPTWHNIMNVWKHDGHCTLIL